MAAVNRHRSAFVVAVSAVAAAVAALATACNQIE